MDSGLDRSSWAASRETVDIFDILIVALEFDRPSPPIEDIHADVNKDGVVDIFDIAIVAIHFGETNT